MKVRSHLSLTVLLLMLGAVPASSYAVLAHEAVIDVLWDARLKPLLLDRFPNSTPDQLRDAHAYAYGGSIIQDLGYYPYGSKFFSDLTHYVRSGDFVIHLMADSKDVNEYAFALGALSHYALDDFGHRVATNRAVPMLYPKVRSKFGDVVTYEDDPIAHMQTEFGFDVLEVARGHFAPSAYHDMIGFAVSKPLLERAFRETYSLDLNSVIKNLDRAIGSYRHAVSRTIPLATKVAWAQRENDIEKSIPGITRRRFLYNMSRSNYEKDWGRDYQRPSLGSRILAFLLKLIPHVGPLRALAFRMPTPQVENLFMQSFNESVSSYRGTLAAAHTRSLKLPNTNFDVGLVTQPGAYKLADKTQAQLLDRLSASNFATVSPELKSELLDYYSDLNIPFYMKKDKKAWGRLLEQLQSLKRTPSSPQIAAAVPVR